MEKPTTNLIPASTVVVVEHPTTRLYDIRVRLAGYSRVIASDLDDYLLAARAAKEALGKLYDPAALPAVAGEFAPDARTCYAAFINVAVTRGGNK